MLLNAKQVEAMLTTNGKGKAAQVGYDITLKGVNMINGGKLLVSGTEVDEYYKINKKLVDLSEPLISEEGKELVESYYSESMDPDGRGHKNLIRMMMEDGLFKYLPKRDDAWVGFLTPFLKLTRKEKTNFKNKSKTKK